MRLSLIISILVFSSSVRSQNLIPNPSFEDTTRTSFGALIPLFWTEANLGSPDYFTEFNSGITGVPYNFIGYQQPSTGFAYMGIGIYGFNPISVKREREYIQTELKETLQRDSLYCLQLFLSLADSCEYSSKGMLAAFLSNSRISSNNSYYLPYIPQIIVSPDDYISDTSNWLKFEVEYLANGGERFITIGNFNDSSLVDTMSTGIETSDIMYESTYYYIDDIYFGNCDSLVGLKENSLDAELNVYPNPIMSFVNVHYSGNSSLSAKLLDLNGRLVHQEFLIKAGSQNKVDLHFLEKGIYNLIISNGKQVTSKKIVKY